MKYPKRSPYLICRRTGSDELKVEHYLLSKTYRLKHKTASFFEQLDGKHDPYSLLPGCSRDRVRQLMKELEECDLLAPKKKPLKTGVGSFIYPLIYCYPNEMPKYLAKGWNLILRIMFIPMLLMGVYLQSQGIFAYMQSKTELYLGMFIGGMLGVALHELSHTCAGLAYNGRLFEIGIGTLHFLPIGYVFMDNSSVKSALKRIQINAAGIEMNLLLYGFFMCLAAAGFFNPFVMMLCGVINLAMAILNSLPLSCFDGIKILSIITGKEDVLEYAKELIKNRKKYLSRQVRNARRVAVITASYGLVCFQIVMPVLVFYEGFSFVRLILL